MAYQAALTSQDQAKRGFQTAQQDRKWQLDLRASASVVRPRNRGPETDSHSGDKRVGLDLRIPINDMHAKQAYVAAEVGVERAAMAVRAAKQAAESKALSLWRRLLATKAEVGMAEKAADLTQQTLANAKLKLQYGRASAFEVTTLRDGLTSKQLAVVSAKIGYADAYAALSEGMGQTLDDWHISLQEGVS
jgi:outer membrane protein TolC